MSGGGTVFLGDLEGAIGPVCSEMVRIICPVAAALKTWEMNLRESFDARVQPEIGPPPAVPADPPSTREENVQATPSEPNYASSFDNAMHGFRRLFGKAGTERIEATWSLEGLSAITVEDCAGKKVPKNQITLPRHGPVIFGAVHNKDNDYIIDIPTVSGRHARFEVIRDRVNGISKCVIMDMGSTNGVWVNRSKIQPFKEVHLFPGDVICLAEPGIAFKVDANDSAPTACPAQRMLFRWQNLWKQKLLH
eukprot:jgi/Picre1/33299/NNA_008623.t1